MARNSRALVVRSSAVITGVDGRLLYFPGRDEMPGPLRAQMDKALHGGLTAMIVLADEGGQAYLHGNQEHAGSPAAPSPAEAPTSAPGWTVELVRWLVLECVGAASLAFLLYFFATGH
jgi:hypothetical protein